jgi:hypothetical protein
MRAPVRQVVTLAASLANARLAMPADEQRPAKDSPVTTAGSQAEVQPAPDASTFAAWTTSMLVSLAAAAGCVIYLVSAWRYSLGSLARPGPGLFPFVAGVILLAGLAGYLASHAAALRRARHRRASRAGTSAVVRAAVAVAAGFFYVFGIQHLNDILVAAVSSFLVIIVAGQKLWVSLLAACLTGVATHYVFVVALGVPIGHGSSL